MFPYIEAFLCCPHKMGLFTRCCGTAGGLLYLQEPGKCDVGRGHDLDIAAEIRR